MLVELGCANPRGRHDDPERRPIVVYSSVPDQVYPVKDGLNVEDWRSHLTRAVMQNDGVTNFDGQGGEASLALFTHPGGAWNELARGTPDWVWSDNPEFARQVSEFHQVPAGRPADYDDRYWRKVGNRLLAPGMWLPPDPFADAQMLLTNVGATASAAAMGGAGTSLVGHGSAITGTSITTNLTLTTNAWAGGQIFVADTTNNVVLRGNVISNTNAAGASVVNVDQWYAVPETGAAGTTPAAGYQFLLTMQPGPFWYVAITTTNVSPAATDTSLSGEATTNGMGRKIGAYTVTSAASGGSITYTISAVFTFSGASSTTFYAMALMNSAVKSDTTDTMANETSFAGSFTVSNSGDTATVTDSLTNS